MDLVEGSSVGSAASLEWLVVELQRETGVAATGVCDLAAQYMPLTHRCGPGRVRDLLATIDASTALEAGIGSANRAALKLDGNVHQWLGPCAYAEASVIFLWHATQDDAIPGVASPWDAAGLRTKGTVGRALTEPQAIALIGAYTLELSAARSYLSAVMECSFVDPGDYLRGRAPARWYPGWGPGAVPRNVMLPAYTFEVRRPCEVPVFAHLIAAVVEPMAFIDIPNALHELRRLAKAHGASYEPCRPREHCHETARRVLWQHLRARGAT